MKIFSAVSLAILVSAGAQAQHRAGAPPRAFSPPTISAPSAIAQQRVGSPVVPSVGALGGSFASTAMSRPLGGIAPPSFPTSGIGNQRRREPETGRRFRYIGPIYYVPNAYDTGYQPYGYSTFDQPANPALYPPPPQETTPQQPVIINQYFSSRNATTQTEGDTTTTAETAPSDPAAVPQAAVPRNGAPQNAVPQNYYLIAYKNHTVYTVLAYWLEGDTLHYVTTQNTHNQASLSLIDLDRTIKLNADNSVPFSLSGK
jgi:hypothetical protein